MRNRFCRFEQKMIWLDAELALRSYAPVNTIDVGGDLAARLTIGC